MNKQQTIELLQKQIPSFYSLEQVINIIKDIEEDKVETKAEINDELIDSIADEIADQGRYLIDDYDLEMSYKEVELSSVDIDRDVIRKAIKSALDNQ
jgi:predicted RND superfamily exporter protein